MIVYEMYRDLSLTFCDQLYIAGQKYFSKRLFHRLKVFCFLISSIE